MDFLEHLNQAPDTVQNVLDSNLDLSQFKVCFGYCKDVDLFIRLLSLILHMTFSSSKWTGSLPEFGVGNTKKVF